LVRESDLALSILPKLFQDSSKQSQRIKKIVAIKEKVEKLIGDDYAVFVNYGRKNFLEGLEPVESQTNMTEEEIIGSFTGFFNGVKQTSKAFLKELAKLKRRIQERNNELNPLISFKVLAEAWLKNNEPGRFYIWLDNYAVEDYAYYQSNYTQEVHSLETAYDFLINDNERLEKNLQVKQASGDWFLEELLKSFQINSISKIEELHKQLKSINNSKTRLALSFSKGLLLESEEKLQEAFEWYSSIDPKYSNYFIQQRVFPLAFHLGKYETGLLSLEQLCKKNMVFIPQYANALEVMGNLSGAIQILEHYALLDKDILACVDLIRFYIKSGQMVKAEELITQSIKNVNFNKSEITTLLSNIGVKI